MVKRYKGGLMGSTEAITSIADARGVWGIVQATQSRNVGNWPGLLATETPGSGSGAGFSNGFMTVSNVSVTDSNYTVLNDTPNISTAGGYIKITGRGFVSGCVVYVGGTPAISTTFISSTEVRAQIAAATSNTLMVYVVNPDGSTGIKLSSLVFSGTPTWATGATLTSQVTDVVFSISFAATSDSAITAYTVDTGSSLPPGTSLFANGLFTGTVTGISSDTTYSFAVVATDTENQDTARTFNVTFSTGDQYFYLTPLLLNGDGNTWIRDSSVNNFLPTIGNDTKPSAFSPYNSNWSGFFDGTGDYLDVSGSSNLAFGTNDFTIEFFAYIVALNTFMMFYDSRTAEGLYPAIYKHSDNTIRYYVNSGQAIAGPALAANTWYHIVVSRVSGITRMFVNGTQVVSTYTDTNNYLNGAGRPRIGANGTDATSGVNGYISNLRVLNGTGYTSVTVPTSRLTTTSQSASNCQLLTLQDNRFVDNSTNAFTITPNGDVSNRSFGPFTETDIVSGSAYFDGTGDHLIVTDNAGMELGAGDFCVECWIYPTSVTNTAVVIDKRSGGYAPLLLWRSGSTLQIYMSLNGSSWGLASAVTVGALSVNRWYHVAVFRVGSSLYTSFNGVVTLVTASGSGTLVNNSTNWYIGTETNGSTNPWTGYIADMRFVVGSGIYTSANFTPTTSSLSSVANTQLLTLQYRRGDNNHRFVEESGVQALTTRTGNPSQGSFSPHSPAGWSTYFNGSSYLNVVSNAAFAFGTGDFTLEAWIFLPVYPSAGTVAGQIISAHNWNGSGFDFGWRVNTAGPLYFEAVGGANLTSTIVVPLGQWNHVACVRSSGTITFYINGLSRGSASITTSIPSTTAISLGHSLTGGTYGALTGYISNARVVKGVAVYTANFTPQTSSLSSTQSSGTNIAAITAGQTSLLTLQDNRFKDNSTNAFALTNGSASIQAFSPFRGSGSYSPATHGGSAYFDGSGDYVYIANNAVMTLGTNDHCIELWMYPNGAQNQYTTVWFYSIGAASGATNTYYFSIGSDAGGGISVLGGPLSGVWAVTLGGLGSTEYNAILNVWTHVVLTRRGSAYRLFLNGVLKAYTTYAGSIIAQGGSFSIGWDGANATTYYKGWLSNFRVINGSIPTAYQTTSTTLGTTIFTPPTSVPAFEANTVMAMNFTNGGIVDATGRITFETLADTKISNVASKFGSGSLYFDGTGDYVVAPSNPAFGFGTGDFTVECWVYFNSTSGTFVPFAQSDALGSSTNDKWFFALGSSTLRLQTHSSGGFTCTTPWTPSTGIWYHIAAVRSSGTILLFINGTSGTVTTTGTPSGYSLSQNGLSIGAMSTPYHLNGYIDDFRITRFARYTASFTVPSSAFLTR
jgi:hypothetical protein